jgi:small subunit ribosomal protein S15
MLTPEQKAKIITEYKLNNLDTGSSEIQIVLLSEKIKQLLLHLKTHPKDFHSKRGLLKMVSERKMLLNYLKKKNIERYNNISKKIESIK